MPAPDSRPSSRATSTKVEERLAREEMQARFEVIEQEKEILEEEHQSSLALGDELHHQLRSLRKARC